MTPLFFNFEFPMHYTPYNDQAVIGCELDRKDWCQRIARNIRDAQAPKTFAIHGTWGSGKTSCLAQINHALEGKNPFLTANELEKDSVLIERSDIVVKTVWFEAWQYQHEDNIVAALLYEIRNQLSALHKLSASVKEETRIGVMALFDSVEVALTDFLKVKKLSSNVVQSTQYIQNENYSTPIPSLMLKKKLQEAINKLLHLSNDPVSFVKNPFRNKKTHKLVIFIDDLDRCEPEVAFRILEAIKIYLNLNNCIFVLGMDQEAVELIIAKHYEKQLDFGDESKEQELRRLSRLYLEKICQDIYHLPVLTQEIKSEYFEALFSDKVTPKQKELLPKLLRHYDILPPIARSIKIYVNALFFFLQHQHIANLLIVEDLNEKEENVKILLILSYLYVFNYEVYQLIYLYPGFYQTFYQHCLAGDVKKSPLADMQLAEPQLSSVIAKVDNTMGERDHTQKNYPHKSLRQVLWIRDLVVDFGTLSESMLKKFAL